VVRLIFVAFVLFFAGWIGGILGDFSKTLVAGAGRIRRHEPPQIYDGLPLRLLMPKASPARCWRVDGVSKSLWGPPRVNQRQA